MPDEMIDTDRVEALYGIENVISAIRDYAVDCMGIPEEKVFNQEDG